jgi:hypothetical protein
LEREARWIFEAAMIERSDPSSGSVPLIQSFFSGLSACRVKALAKVGYLL